MREVAGEVEREGGRAHVVPTDVADGPRSKLAREAVDRFGRIDTWVNDAGVAIGGTVEGHEIAEIERIVRVNLLGQIFGVKAALPYMKEQGGGAFICLGSVAAVRSFPLQTIYCVTKHGVKALCEGLRLELQREPGGVARDDDCPPGDQHAPVRAGPDEIRQRSWARPAQSTTPGSWPSRSSSPPSTRARHLHRGGREDARPDGADQPVAGRLVPDAERPGLQRADHRPAERRAPDNLFQPPPGPRRVRGSYGDEAKSTSFYTRAFEWHPTLKPIALAAVSIGAAAILETLPIGHPACFRPAEACDRRRKPSFELQRPRTLEPRPEPRKARHRDGTPTLPRPGLGA